MLSCRFIEHDHSWVQHQNRSVHRPGHWRILCRCLCSVFRQQSYRLKLEIDVETWLCHSSLPVHWCRSWFLHHHWIQWSSSQHGSIQMVCVEVSGMFDQINPYGAWENTIIMKYSSNDKDNELCQLVLKHLDALMLIDLLHSAFWRKKRTDVLQIGIKF